MAPSGGIRIYQKVKSWPWLRAGVAKPPAATFAALADPTRLAIVERLRRGTCTLSQVAEPLPMTLAAVLKHVRILEACGIVASRRIGRLRHLRLRGAALRQATAYLSTYEAFWSRRLDALEDYLAQNPDG
jgi:DNA-binding transcriptional ArsR family regulator